MTEPFAGVVAALHEARELTLATVLDHLPADPDTAEFYEIVAEYPRRAGKGIRPALCLAAARAHGGRTEDALGPATALELMHNAYLVHDDICDEAQTRRGAPALHAAHGIPLGLMAGNALVWMSLELMLGNSGQLRPRLVLDVMTEFHHMTRRTLEGQAAELLARHNPLELDPDGYLAVVLDKTCWYSAIYPCRIGALIGSRGRADLDAIASYALFVGAVLQIRNDVESLTDVSGAAGQDFGADIIEGKPTLPLIHLRREASVAERARVAGLVGPAGDASGIGAAERVAEVLELMKRYGSIDYACAFADGLAHAALAEFDAALGWLPASADKAFLRDIVLYLRDPEVRGYGTGSALLATSPF